MKWRSSFKILDVVRTHPPFIFLLVEIFFSLFLDCFLLFMTVAIACLLGKYLPFFILWLFLLSLTYMPSLISIFHFSLIVSSFCICCLYFLFAFSNDIFLSLFSYYFSFLRLFLFSCPKQLNRWPCHWLTDSLTVLLLLTYKERP